LRGRESGAAARSKCFLHNVKQVLPVHFTCKCRGGEGKREGRGGRRGRKEGEEEEEEELEGFDAMQTGSTKARRQKFSTHHKNKSA